MRDQMTADLIQNAIRFATDFHTMTAVANAILLIEIAIFIILAFGLAIIIALLRRTVDALRWNEPIVVQAGTGTGADYRDIPPGVIVRVSDRVPERTNPPERV